MKEFEQNSLDAENRPTGTSRGARSEQKSGYEPVFLVLEVQTPEEGLKKATEVLGLQAKELKYQIIDKVNRDVEGELVEFLRIEFTRKPLRGTPEILISDDKLSATIKALYPKKPDGTENTYASILLLVREAKITHGLDKEAIKEAVNYVQESYDILEDVEIARGTPPINGDCRILQSLFTDMDKINYKLTHELGLDELFSMDSCDRIRENAYPVWFVKKGELLVLTTKPSYGKTGRDIFGKAVFPQKGKLLFEAGDHVKIGKNKDNLIYNAEISGYLEIKNDTLRIQSPIWISPDWMDVYFINLPIINPLKKNLDCLEITEQLQAAGITRGIISSEITAIPERFEKTQPDFDAIKVASGVPPKKGKDAWVEFFFERDVQPGKLLENGVMDYREIGKIKTVKQNQLIAVKYLAEDGIPGENVRGEVNEEAKGDDITFYALENVRTLGGKNKIMFYSNIEGSVKVIENKGITVKPVCHIRGDLDFSTGNIDFNGDVSVDGSVLSGFRIHAKGNITVGGAVNKKVILSASGNIIVKKGIIGLVGVQDTILQAQGSVMADYVQGATIETGGDIIVNEYIMNSAIKAKGKVILPSPFAPSIMKGSIMGGEIIAFKGVEAISIGSEMSAKTKIIVGQDPDLNIKQKKLQDALEYCDKEYAQVSKTLRIDALNPQEMKKRMERMAQRDRLLYIDKLKRLKRIINIQNELKKKQKQLMEEKYNLARQAEIIVKKVLYSRVTIQIGELQKRIDNTISSLKINISRNGKQLDLISL